MGIFWGRLPEGVTKHDGGARCHLCNKKTWFSHFRYNDGDYFYCKSCIQNLSPTEKAINNIKAGKQKHDYNIHKDRNFTGYCVICNNKINDCIDAFFCKYCKKWHCAKHRLPEDHKCPNPKTPKGMKSSIISYGRK